MQNFANVILTVSHSNITRDCKSVGVFSSNESFDILTSPNLLAILVTYTIRTHQLLHVK